MNNVTDSFVSLGHWPSAGSFGINTDILATNPINLSVVIGLLIFFGKRVLSDLLDNRKQRILNTIQDSEELGARAIEELEKARSHLRKVEIKADQYRVNEYSKIEEQKWDLINLSYKTLEQYENNKNETIHFQQKRVINQIQQRVFQKALQRALGTLKSSLNKELHLRIIHANIRLLSAMKERTD
uniref:ATP synthase CF0 subunit I n=1 Tax=Drosera indica TaxID=16680 RepID=A0A411K3A1_9CARY|nr:ATP synthase CF0 subunit I [Drosera indica]